MDAVSHRSDIVREFELIAVKYFDACTPKFYRRSRLTNDSGTLPYSLVPMPYMYV